VFFKTKLPSAQLDVDVKTFAKIVCSILDIPVYQNSIESLHLLFTLYAAFKENQHFQTQNTSASLLNSQLYNTLAAAQNGNPSIDLSASVNSIDGLKRQ
jgi:hypothetical protein